MQELRKLLAGSCGRAIIARRLTNAEVKVFERERRDSDAGMHARLVVKEEERSGAPAWGQSTLIVGVDARRRSRNSLRGWLLRPRKKRHGIGSSEDTLPRSAMGPLWDSPSDRRSPVKAAGLGDRAPGTARQNRRSTMLP